MRAAIAFAAALAAAPAAACEVELILAMDVSRSVMNDEYDHQMLGLAAAFRDERVIELIGFAEGGVMATVTQWSGEGMQTQSVPWRRIEAPEDARAFAAEIEMQDRHYFGAYTATGDALLHARAISAQNPVACRRKVIDVSGDGRRNRGAEPRAVADALAAEGYTINALAVLGAKPNPLDYYITHVIAGPGAFAEVADSFADYPAAIRRKLLRELSPSFAMVDE